MRLTITNFRRYRNKTSIDFKDGITKIAGHSGAGKTTIFAAIEWCLYGKVRKIKPTGHTGSTNVIMSMPMPACHNIKTWLGVGDVMVNVKVDRASSTNVTLTLGTKTYEDHEAQARIDIIFGDVELFKVTSYLRAEEMHPMLVATPGVKREITSILFPDASKHSIYKDKISNIRKDLLSSLNDVNVKMARINGIISTIEEHHSWVKDQHEEGDTLDVDNIKDSISKERHLHAEATRQKQRLMALNEEKEAIPPTVDVSMHEEEMEGIRGKLQQSVIDVASREARLSSMKERMSSIDLASIPTKEECSKTSTDCMSILSMGLSTFSSSELEELQSKKKELQEQLKSCGHTDGKEYTCPACASSLYTLNDKLVVDKPVVSGKDPSTIRRSINQLDTRMATLEDAMEKYQVYQGKDIRSLMSKMNAHTSTHEEYERLQRQMDAVPPMPDTYITPADKASMQKRLSHLDDLIKKNMSNKDRLERVTSSIEKMEKDYPHVKDETYITSILDRISSLEDQMAKAIESKKRKDIKDKHTNAIHSMGKMTKASDEIKKKVETCARLTSVIDDVYGQYVGSMLRSIEHDISCLAKIMFDRTMNVSLHASTTSVSGITRPSFDMKIQYNGVEYDDVRSMSTGEKKRLSIILMIVLTKYTDGRIMLLDEALTSVGMEQRGLIMNEINRLGIPILITSHDDVPGGYDNEITIQ